MIVLVEDSVYSALVVEVGIDAVGTAESDGFLEFVGIFNVFLIFY